MCGPGGREQGKAREGEGNGQEVSSFGGVLLRNSMHEAVGCARLDNVAITFGRLMARPYLDSGNTR